MFKKLPKENNWPMGENSPNLVTLATAFAQSWACPTFFRACPKKFFRHIENNAAT
jgi:hypothetical protein